MLRCFKCVSYHISSEIFNCGTLPSLSWDSPEALAAEGKQANKACQPDSYQLGCANLHGRLVINETHGIWLLLHKLPVTSALVFSGYSQEALARLQAQRKE